MTLAGAEGWFKICELLRAEAAVTPIVHCGYASPFVGIVYSDRDLDVNMAESPYAFTPYVASRKRGRENDDVEFGFAEESTRYEKKQRPTSGHSNTSDTCSQAQDSVFNTPRSISKHSDFFPPLDLRRNRAEDSDQYASSISEAGSMQDHDIDMEMSSPALAVDDTIGNDDEVTPAPLPSPALAAQGHCRLPTGFRPLANPTLSPWSNRLERTTRVATPILPNTHGSPLASRLKVQLPHSSPASNPSSSHIRHRHPQANPSDMAGLLEVPSPIDEDEIPTPPSAAEAAGSQLSLLSVNDMEVEPGDSAGVPAIALQRTATGLGKFGTESDVEGDSAIADDSEPMDALANNSLDAGLFVRKQRARSGALSSGGSPSASPARTTVGSGLGGFGIGMGRGEHKRGLSVGYRADCQKCVMRVPGHMNHFTL